MVFIFHVTLEDIYKKVRNLDSSKEYQANVFPNNIIFKRKP